MSALTPVQLSALQGVFAQTPDLALERLETRLSEDAVLASLRSVRDMVRAEGEDRRARAAVLAPLLPMCRADGAWPASVPGLLWRGLKARAPSQVKLVVELGRRVRPAEESDRLADILCREAAKGLREREGPDFVAAAEALDAARPAGCESFAVLLDLAPIARSALARLPEWLQHMHENAAAAVRLAFKDATEVTEDGGVRLIEILYAHLDDPGRVLRLISAVMDRPQESFLAASELAGLGERVLDEIDGRIAAVTAMDPDQGREAGARAGEAAAMAVSDITEFERGVELAPAGLWGQRVARQKRALASAVESRLKGAEKAVGAALPLQSRKRGAVRALPDLSADADPRQTARAMALLGFLDAIRLSAGAGGFGRPRAEAVETLSAMLDQYVEDLLEVLHAGDPELVPRARAYLDLAAECLALVSDDRAAEVARRRAAAA